MNTTYRSRVCLTPSKVGLGRGGAVTGRRADLAILDDVIKGREEADSEAIREKAWLWYLSDLRTRLKADGAIVLIMTRWHPDDLARAYPARNLERPERLD